MTLIDEIQAIGMACYEAGIWEPLRDYCEEQGVMVFVTATGVVYGPVTKETRWFMSTSGRRWSVRAMRSPQGWICTAQHWARAGSPRVWIGASGIEE